MTIDDLIRILQEQKELHGGDTKVVALWDSAVTDLDLFGFQNGALIFDVECWGESDVEFDYRDFKCEVRKIK